MAVRGSESPMAAQQAAPPWGIPRAVENRRETASFPCLTAAKPPRSECPAGHRQPVGGAPASPAPAVLDRRGRNDPQSVSFKVTILPEESEILGSPNRERVEKNHERKNNKCTSNESTQDVKRAKTLLKLTQKDALDEIVWKRDEMDAIIELKECMCRAPALATLDPVAAALMGCLRAVAAVGISLNQSEGIVMGHPLTVIVPHSVEILLTCSRAQHMTGARLTRYETIILGSPNVQLKRCTTLNPATLFPSENVEIENAKDIEHDCLQVTEFCTKPRPDIKDTRLAENDQIIFVDVSCLRDALGMLKAGYAVCTITGVLEASWLQGVYSAQVAELVALTRACQLSALMKVTIYTDSQYGFGIVHDFGQLWSQRGFMTSSGTPVKNGERIRELLHAIQLPGEVAVEKCSAHSKSQDLFSLGNGYADQVARKSGLSPHEILMGRAMRLPAVPANALANITDDMVLDYCKGLADVVRSFSHQVEATTLPPIQGPGHALKAGDWVVIKKHVRKSYLELRWKGPFQVILTTTTAVKCAGVPNWIHASHTKRVTCPTEEKIEALKLPATDRKVSGTETERREPENAQEEIETEEIFSEEDAVDPFEDNREEASGSDKDPEGDKDPVTGEEAGKPNKRRAFPEADDTGRERENLIDLLKGRRQDRTE
ncbi:hypothetical protein NDU88_007183 [Pleurodeles waltl]|uniref:RNase H type-1 domain-containing protein n=1 Tax=Pleurodeles waltl TaxID=8319 RepID=A0AAV7TZ03_PLEWA|nr:hypothetical protein NDU88_007183 [Pleurodeles waltl]